MLLKHFIILAAVQFTHVHQGGKTVLTQCMGKEILVKGSLIEFIERIEI